MEKELSTREKNALLKKRNILRAGLKLFQNPGYFQSDIRAISKEAGIGLGTYYNYFPDKLSLYLTIFEQEFRRIGTMILTETEKKQLLHLPLREFVGFLLKHQLQNHNHSQLFYREASVLMHREPEVNSLNETLKEEIVGTLKELLSHFKEIPAKENFDIKLKIILIAIDENIHDILDKKEGEQELYLKELQEMVLCYITA